MRVYRCRGNHRTTVSLYRSQIYPTTPDSIDLTGIKVSASTVFWNTSLVDQ
jgi:hypothetical protein